MVIQILAGIGALAVIVVIVAIIVVVIGEIAEGMAERVRVRYWAGVYQADDAAWSAKKARLLALAEDDPERAEWAAFEYSFAYEVFRNWGGLPESWLPEVGKQLKADRAHWREARETWENAHTVDEYHPAHKLWRGKRTV